MFDSWSCATDRFEGVDNRGNPHYYSGKRFSIRFEYITSFDEGGHLLPIPLHFYTILNLQ
jgi:hypothetical protein